jgi:very-short-patch-repair endonuclease
MRSTLSSQSARRVHAATPQHPWHAHRIPRPRMNHRIGPYEVDAVWPASRLVAELDGYAYHRHSRAFERDRVKANALQAAGFAVVRFTHRHVVREPAYVAATLARMLPPAYAG